MFKKKKSPLRAPKLVRRRRQILGFKITMIIVLVIGLVCGAIALTRIAALQITDVEVKGAVAVESAEIIQTANDYLYGNYFYLFPHRNRYIYPKQVIEHALHDRFKRVQDVDIKQRGQILTITITERSPAYLWCRGSDVHSTEACYFMDKQGFVYAEAPIFSGKTFFSFYGVLPDEPIGKTFLTPEQFDYVADFAAYLNSKQLDVYALSASLDGTYTIYMNRGGKLIVSANQTVSELVPIVETLLQNNQIQSTSTALDYVDLRFGNKVFFKTNGDKPVE